MALDWLLSDGGIWPVVAVLVDDEEEDRRWRNRGGRPGRHLKGDEEER